MTHPARCRLRALLGFPLRDSAAAPKKRAAPKEEQRARAAVRSRAGPAEFSGAERRRAAMRSPTPLPKEIHRSAQRGELQKVVKWLRKGGPVDALYSATARATRGLGQQPQIDLLDRYNIPSLDR